MPALYAALVVPAATTPTTSKSSGGGSYLIIVVILAVLAFLILNARRRAKANATAAPTWEVGSMVVTRAGLIARLVVQTDDYVVLQLEDGTRARFVPQAIGRLWEEPGEPDAAARTDDNPPVNLAKDPAEDLLQDDNPAIRPGTDQPADREPPAGGGPLAD